MGAPVLAKAAHVSLAHIHAGRQARAPRASARPAGAGAATCAAIAAAARAGQRAQQRAQAGRAPVAQQFARLRALRIASCALQWILQRTWGGPVLGQVEMSKCHSARSETKAWLVRAPIAAERAPARNPPHLLCESCPKYTTSRCCWKGSWLGRRCMLAPRRTDQIEFGGGGGDEFVEQPRAHGECFEELS